jgi:hypothetical protein
MYIISKSNLCSAARIGVHDGCASVKRLCVSTGVKQQATGLIKHAFNQRHLLSLLVVLLMYRFQAAHIDSQCFNAT